MSDIGKLNAGGFATRKVVTPEQQNQKLKDVAESYEKHFMRELVKSMRSTVSESGLVKTSQGEKIFKEQLDEQYVEAWSKQGGIGLADMIHKQLLSRFGEQMGIKAPTERPHGPIALDPKSRSTLQQSSSTLGFRTQSSAANKSVEVSISDADHLSREVTPPWSGILSSIEKSETGENILGVDHENGFRSQLRFQGELVTNLRPGRVEAGQALGNWDSGQGEMNWQVEFQPEKQPDSRLE